MIKVKEGDLDKLGLLFERYKKPLFGFFYGMSKDAELCEDLVQNVFYRVLRYRDAFKGEGNFRTWVFHIARNVFNDNFRKTRIKKKESLDHWHEQLTTGENRFVSIQSDEELTMLALAMDRLPPDRREVLLLSKFHDKKYKEIGEILGCTEAAVKVKVFRALQDLKEIYHQLEKRM